MSAQPAQPILYLVPAGDSRQGWLTPEQVMAATGWSRTTFFRRAKELISRESTDAGANGRTVREYLAASLPAADKLAGESAPPSGDGGSALELPRQASLFASQPSPARVTLPDPDDQKQAEERFAAIEPVLDYARDAARWAQLGIRSQAQLLRYQAEHTGNDVRTLHRWVSRYRSGGFPALADRKRSDRDRSRWFAEHREAAIAAAAGYLEYKQSCRVCYEIIEREHAKLGLAEGDLPSYETVRTFLKSMPPYLKTYAREGRRKYEEMFSPYLGRDYSALVPNQIWVSDHMIHDVEVANDCFPELEWGAPMRLRFTALFDMASRYVVGYSWCPEGSSRSIATALRRAFAQWGPCEHFYCDNGRDYRKVAKGAMPGYLVDPAAIRGWHLTEVAAIEKTGLLAQLGIRVTHCIAHHPQSKHIERFFRTLHERFDKRFWQHYTGGAPHLRPDATAAAMEIHRKLMKHGRVESTTHPAASLLIALCMAWIEEYHQRDHSGQGMDGRAPAEVFAERAAPRPLDGQSSLALLFPEHARRKVRECAVTMHQRRYTYCDAVSRDVLHQMTDREVTVAWDPNDADTVAILDETGHFLCAAQADELVRFDPGAKDVQQRIADSMADRRHLEKSTRGTIEHIARAARALGVASPVEALTATAKLPQSIARCSPTGAPKRPLPRLSPRRPQRGLRQQGFSWRHFANESNDGRPQQRTSRSRPAAQDRAAGDTADRPTACRRWRTTTSTAPK